MNWRIDALKLRRAPGLPKDSDFFLPANRLGFDDADGK
jgi:hypothetical protein